MNFTYSDFKKQLERKFEEKLTKTVIDELLTFERGLLDNAFPQKRIIIERIKFNGDKGNQSFNFDRKVDEGINLILADNLKGKSSVFKVIKYALTGDDDLAKDIKSWLKNIYIEFSLKTDSTQHRLTSFLNFEKTRLTGGLYSLSIDELIDKEVDPRKRIFHADSERSFKTYIQDFFFQEFDFYHLNWTQKSPVKDKNELIEAKASWNTYFESIYLSSKNSSKLAYGGQEELIFQMLLGLKHTHPINRLKVKFEMESFELAKAKDAIQFNVQKSEVNVKNLKKDFDRIEREIEKIKNKDLKNINVSDYYTERNQLINSLNTRNSELAKVYATLFRTENQKTLISNEIKNKKTEIKTYKDRIKKALKSKVNLEEYIQFGIFFSNLEITVCPHCNTSIKKNPKKENSKECILCNHLADDNTPSVNKIHYQSKIDSLNAEINGYNSQVNLLQLSIDNDDSSISRITNEIKDVKIQTTELEAANKEDQKRLKQIDSILNKASQEVKMIDRLIELQSKKAVLEFQLKEYENKTQEGLSDKILNIEYRMELLDEALKGLKEQRAVENDDILLNFQKLLLEELRDLGIVGISQVRLSESFKIQYNQNSNWVSFDDISEGEQLRVKIAFYLAIIQCDIKFKAGRHPRLLIIDSPNKEEGDKVYTEGLKRLLQNLSNKYGAYLQIIIGTASRELHDSVSPEKSFIYEEGEFVF